MVQTGPKPPGETAERSLEALLDPVSLEARLIEARVRRAEAMSRRAGHSPARRGLPQTLPLLERGASHRSASAERKVASSPAVATTPAGNAAPASVPWPQRYPRGTVLLLGFAVGVFATSVALVTLPLSVLEWGAERPVVVAVPGAQAVPEAATVPSRIPRVAPTALPMDSALAERPLGIPPVSPQGRTAPVSLPAAAAGAPAVALPAVAAMAVPALPSEQSVLPFDPALLPLPTPQPPGASRDAPVALLTALGGAQTGGLPAVAAIPAPVLPAEPSPLPTDVALLSLPPLYLPALPAETSTPSVSALRSDHPRVRALVSYAVEAPQMPAAAASGDTIAGVAAARRPLLGSGVEPAAISVEVARLEAQTALHFADQRASRLRAALAAPGAEAGFPVQIDEGHKGPAAAEGVTRTKPKVANATSVQSARSGEVQAAPAMPVKRFVSERTVEDLLRARILGK